MSDTREPKATIYTDRRESRLASVRDKRDAFEALIEIPDPNHEGEVINKSYYGLASTEHRFGQALLEHMCEIRRLTARDIQAAMAEELASMSLDKGAK